MFSKAVWQASSRGLGARLAAERTIAAAAAGRNAVYNMASAASASAAAAVASSAPGIAADAASPSKKPALRKPGNAWRLRLKVHILYHRNREKEEKKISIIRSRADVFMSVEEESVCDGRKRLNKLNWWLNNLGDQDKPETIIRRSPDQIRFHRHFIDAMLPKIFGLDWNSQSVRIMEERKIMEIRYEVTAITPRRWGKTWSVAMFVLATMLSVPGIIICVFSTGKRASCSLMEIILQYMNMIPGLNRRILVNNQEVSQIQ